MRLLALVAVLAPAVATAAPIPLSELPAKPVQWGRPRIPKAGVELGRSDIRLSKGCVVENVPRYWTSGVDDLDEEVRGEYTSADPPFGIEHLIERGGKATLERTRAQFHSYDTELHAYEHSSIALHPVARVDGHTIYAYRADTNVYLVARADRASVRFDSATGKTTRAEVGCTIAIVVMRVRKGSSQVVQIDGLIPGTKKRFLATASISQTSRDPEPLLAITARRF